MFWIDTVLHVTTALFIIFLTWALILIVLTSLKGFWVDVDSLIQDLERLGYSEIKILHHAWFLIAFRGGGKDDVAKFTISAKNPTGRRAIFYIYAKIRPEQE